MQLVNKKLLFHKSKTLEFSVSGEGSFDIQHLSSDFEVAEAYVTCKVLDKSQPTKVSVYILNADNSTTLIAEDVVDDEVCIHLDCYQLRYIVKVISPNCKVTIKLIQIK